MNYPSSISAEELSQLNYVDFQGPISVITQMDQEYAEAIDYLRKQEIIGFDTETKPCFTAGMPKRPVALLQLSGPDRAFIFRLTHIGIPPSLAEILADNKILKIGAAVKDDVNGLKRYRKFNAKAFIDLQLIVGNYGIQEKSVRKMAAIILGEKVSKTQQLSNWEAPSLSGAQIKYAATDAWVCREMYVKLNTKDEKHNTKKRKG